MSEAQPALLCPLLMSPARYIPSGYPDSFGQTNWEPSPCLQEKCAMWKIKERYVPSQVTGNGQVVDGYFVPDGGFCGLAGKP